jgi:hypothetical protein
VGSEWAIPTHTWPSPLIQVYLNFADIRRFTDGPSWHVQLGLSLAHLSRYDAARQAAEQGRAAGMSELDALEITYAIAWMQHDLPGALEVVGQALALGSEQEEGE